MAQSHLPVSFKTETVLLRLFWPCTSLMPLSGSESASLGESASCHDFWDLMTDSKPWSFWFPRVLWMGGKNSGRRFSPLTPACMCNASSVHHAARIASSIVFCSRKETQVASTVCRMFSGRQKSSHILFSTDYITQTCHGTRITHREAVTDREPEWCCQKRWRHLVFHFLSLSGWPGWPNHMTKRWWLCVWSLHVWED